MFTNKDIKEYKKQAEEIIYKNGECPTNIVCNYCVYKYINGTVKDCCQDTAMNTAKRFLNNF
jgi:hypothetical protein